jgi:RNA polymerase primary sigma factor
MSDDAWWLQQLKALGEAQGFLTYAQVNEGMPLAIVDPLEIEAIAENLRRSGIQVVPDSPANSK